MVNMLEAAYSCYGAYVSKDFAAGAIKGSAAFGQALHLYAQQLLFKI